LPGYQDLRSTYWTDREEKALNKTGQIEH
jgi:hypothetical protein